MYLRICNSSLLLLPLGAINAPQAPTWVYTLTLTTEVILQSAAIAITLQFCWLAFTVRCFHVNLTAIAVVATFQWFECFIARMCIFPFQLGWLQVQETQPIGNEETRTMCKMGPEVILIIGAFLRWHYLYFELSAISLFCIERGMASYWLSDYERLKNGHLGAIIIILAEVVTVFWSIGTFFSYISIFASGIAAMSLLTVAVCVYGLIWYYNLRVQKKSDISKTYVYSLAARFQARENARSLKLARRILAFGTVSIAVFIGCCASLYYHLLPEQLEYICPYLIETALNLNPLFIIPLLISSVPPWKQKVCKVLRPTKLDTTKSNVNIAVAVKKETELHFRQLEKMWDQ